MNHPWFDDIDFNDIMEKEVDAPFKPNLKKKIGKSISRSDDKDKSIRSTETIIDDKSKKMIEENSDKFADF
jgi:hypothetical protein